MLNLDPQLVQIATVFIVTAIVLAVVYTVLNSIFGKSKADMRQQNISNIHKPSANVANDSMLNNRRTDQKRKEIQNKLKKREKGKKNKKVTMPQRLLQAGLGISINIFYVLSVVCGVVCAFLALMFTANLMIAGGALFIGIIGVPRFVLNWLKKRRQAKFLKELPNAIDVVVRGVRSGLPLNDALKMIAEEAAEPLRSEFSLLINEQKMGITIQEGLFRMNGRLELPELNFLAIVVNIQQTMGGNLSETLANLSKIIRDRHKMRAKIDAMSTEAKSSAAIIGALPGLIILAISFMSPGYMDPLFETQMGHFMIGGSIFWMTCGILVMRQMINMKI
ncbi:MAG: type II secretion system F family protein [OCS116 cluster bacterium]|uniref:Pilus assembly protein n=1 Tax=OCS116 cluster bacterium TaxID=2030921 RepID=A0A2A4YWV9_9PROT|nr:type II secretion system F family protein [OCS116 cluster bacterium]